MPSLVDRFLANVHDAPVTAACSDPWSGTRASADESGCVVITRAGEATPGLRLQHDAPVRALALVRGGALLAVGDDAGTVAVIRVDEGREVFRESREGQRGRDRAMRAVALNPEGSRLAAIAADGVLRTWDVSRGARTNAWSGFGGKAVDFDERGSRILCLDQAGQPRLVDLLSNQLVPLDALASPAEYAMLTLDGTHVIAAGSGEIAALRLADGVRVASFATRGGSGLLALVQRPDGKAVAAVSQRSVHVFSLPDLQPLESARHGAPDPRGAAFWGQEGWRVGGADGGFHFPGGAAAAMPCTWAGGFGAWRLLAQGAELSAWKGDRRLWRVTLEAPVRSAQMEREGRTVAVLLQGAPVVVLDGRNGQRLFDGGPDTAQAPEVAVGGPVVAVMLPSGGVRWWHLDHNRGFQLADPVAMALSHGGTWLAVADELGVVRVLDPADGREGLAQVELAAPGPVRTLAFVNRRPLLLVLDGEHIMATVDLAEGIPAGGMLPRATARDILQFPSPPDRCWGISGGQLAALRFPERGGAAVAWIDLAEQRIVSEVGDLPAHAEVDVESGNVLAPARAASLLERSPEGAELRVLRALGGEDWVCFGPRGILDASPGAAERIG
jgi:hypothetical protein